MSGRALPLAAVLLIAGCMAAAPGGSDAPTTGTTPVVTSGSNPCQPAGVPVATSAENSPAYPPLPAGLSRSSAEQFAVAFEEALAWHRAFDGSQDEVTVRIHQVGVEETDEGYVVRIEEVVVTTRSGTEIGDDSWSAFYLVSASGVERGEGHAGAPAEAPPRSEWAVVCR